MLAYAKFLGEQALKLIPVRVVVLESGLRVPWSTTNMKVQASRNSRKSGGVPCLAAIVDFCVKEKVVSSNLCLARHN